MMMMSITLLPLPFLLLLLQAHLVFSESGSCSSFSAQFTRSATTNTEDCLLPQVCPGQTITLSMCAPFGGDCRGDAFIRLVSEDSGEELVINDDYCDTCPQLSYSPNNTATKCESLVLKQGCQSIKQCAGETHYLLQGQPNSNTDFNNTWFPTIAPTTMRPTLSPTMSLAPSFMPTISPSFSFEPTFPPWYSGVCGHYDETSESSSCDIPRLDFGEVLVLTVNHTFGNVSFALYDTSNSKKVDMFDVGLITSHSPKFYRRDYVPMIGGNSYLLTQSCSPTVVCDGVVSYSIHKATVLCGPGKESNQHAEGCLPCPIGTYQPASNYFGLCSVCPGDRTTADVGSIALVQCVNGTSSLLVGYLLGIIFMVIWFIYFLRGRIFRVGCHSRFMVHKRGMKNLDIAFLTLSYTWMASTISILRKRYEEGKLSNIDPALLPKTTAELNGDITPTRRPQEKKKVPIPWRKRLIVWFMSITICFALTTLGCIQMIAGILMSAMIMIRSIARHNDDEVVQSYEQTTSYLFQQINQIFHSSWMETLFIPYNKVMVSFAQASIPFVSMGISCEGPLMITRLSIGLILLVITILFVMSDVQIYWSVSLMRVFKHYFAVVVRQYHLYVENKETMIIISVAWGLLATMIVPEPRTVIQYVFTFFVFPFIPTTSYFGSCGYTVDYMSQQLAVVIAFICGWPILYTISFVLCPSFDVSSFNTENDQLNLVEVDNNGDVAGKDQPTKGNTIYYEGKVYKYQDLATNSIAIPLSRQNAVHDKSPSTSTFLNRLVERFFSHYVEYLVFAQYLLTSLTRDSRRFLRSLASEDEKHHFVGVQKLRRIVHYLKYEACPELSFHWLSLLLPMTVSLDESSDATDYEYWSLQQRLLPNYKSYVDHLYRDSIDFVPQIEHYVPLQWIVYFLCLLSPYQMLFPLGRDVHRCVFWNLIHMAQVTFGLWTKVNVDCFQVLNTYDITRPLPMELPTEKDIKEVDICLDAIEEKIKQKKINKQKKKNDCNRVKTKSMVVESHNEEDNNKSLELSSDGRSSSDNEGRSMESMERGVNIARNCKRFCRQCSKVQRSALSMICECTLRPSRVHRLKFRNFFKPQSSKLSHKDNPFAIGNFDYVTSVRRRFFSKDVVTDKQERKMRRKLNKSDQGILEFIQAMMSVRMILFQLLPFGAIVALFAVDLSISPLLVYSGELLSRIPPWMIWTPYKHTIRKMQLKKVYPTLFLPIFIHMCYEMVTQARVIVFFSLLWKNVAILHMVLNGSSKDLLIRAMLYGVIIRSAIYGMKTSLEIYYVLITEDDGEHLDGTLQYDQIPAQDYLIFDEVLRKLRPTKQVSGQSIIARSVSRKETLKFQRQKTQELLVQMSGDLMQRQSSSRMSARDDEALSEHSSPIQPPPRFLPAQSAQELSDDASRVSDISEISIDENRLSQQPVFKQFIPDDDQHHPPLNAAQLRAAQLLRLPSSYGVMLEAFVHDSTNVICSTDYLLNDESELHDPIDE